MQYRQSWILCTILVTFLLSVVGCANGIPFPENSDEEQYNQYDALPAGSLSKFLESFALGQPAEEIVQSVYAKGDFLSCLGISVTGEIIDHLSFPPRSLVGINRYYPVECVRQVGDSLIYVVYRLEDDGQEFNAYFFFEKLDPSQTAADENMEVWWLTGRVLFSCTELSYDDFSSIRVGSSVLEVEMIDPVTQIAIPEGRGPVKVQNFDFEVNDYVEETVMPEPVLEYKEYHLLTDGILCITYSRSDAEQEFIVRSMDFNAAFEVMSNYEEGTVKLNILPIDYPQV